MQVNHSTLRRMLALLVMISCVLRCSGKTHYIDAWNTSSAEKDPSFFQDWADNEKIMFGDKLEFVHIIADLQIIAVRNFSQSSKCELIVSSEFQPIENATDGSAVYTMDEIGLFEFRHPNYSNCFRYNMRFTVYIDESGESHPVTSGPMTSAKHPHFETKWLGVAIGGAVAIVLSVFCLTAFMMRRKYWGRLGASQVVFSATPSPQREELGAIGWPWGPKRFTYNELSSATKSFSSSQVLGEGGFGTVYKGVLRESGLLVAVKRLSQFARQGAREFMAEVNIISQLRHRNLVQLLGWCDDDEELILVYEYMPNGDLDELIFGYGGHESKQLNPLSWTQRYNILCGVATALVYLHEEWEQRVVHRDVKTSNVMLDSQFNARLGDFGLARLSAHSQAPRTTLVAGTIGYLAPEFNLSGKATDKTDVYAFGVVVLEVSCARRPLTPNCILVDWVWELHKEGKLPDAIDPKIDIRSTQEEEEMKRALQLGLLCCHPDPCSRPSMRQVLNFLTGETPLPKMPRSKPVAYFVDLG